MHRLRLHFILGLAVAFGACTARAQDASKGLDDQIQNKFDTQDQDSGKVKKQEQAKVRNDDQHRKHWYSMPHFHHKKHDKDAAAPQADAAPVARTVAAKPMSEPVAPKATMKNASFDSSKNMKPRPKQTASQGVTTSKPAHKTMAGKGHGSKSAKATTPHKRMAKNNHTKKPVKHNCTPEDSKKGGCQASHQQVAKAAHS